MIAEIKATLCQKFRCKVMDSLLPIGERAICKCFSVDLMLRGGKLRLSNLLITNIKTKNGFSPRKKPLITR